MHQLLRSNDINMTCIFMHFIVALSFKWMALMLYFHTDFLIYMWTRSTVIISKRLSMEKFV